MNTKCIDKRVRVALGAVGASEKHAQRMIAEAWPVGSEVRWERGGGIQIGNVVSHSTFRAGTDIRVENMRTRKSYWIWVGDIRK